MIFLSLHEQNLKAILGFSWDSFQIKPLLSLILIYPTTESTLTAKMAWASLHMHTHKHSLLSPSWTDPFPDFHFDAIISLITHDAEGCINVLKTLPSVNHQTHRDTSNYHTCMHCDHRGENENKPALHETLFHTSQQCSAHKAVWTVIQPFLKYTVLKQTAMTLIWL